jgi:transcriptional regulator with XRE-family HTH domain
MNWTQEKLAKQAGMKQARISVLEQADYENFSFNTLKRIAAAFDVAVVVDFVSLPEFLKWSENLSPETVTPQSLAKGGDANRHAIKLDRHPPADSND